MTVVTIVATRMMFTRDSPGYDMVVEWCCAAECSHRGGKIHGSDRKCPRVCYLCIPRYRIELTQVLRGSIACRRIVTKRMAILPTSNSVRSCGTVSCLSNASMNGVELLQPAWASCRPRLNFGLTVLQFWVVADAFTPFP
jgi:hypothetical protein